MASLFNDYSVKIFLEETRKVFSLIHFKVLKGKLKHIKISNWITPHKKKIQKKNKTNIYQDETISQIKYLSWTIVIKQSVLLIRIDEII